MNETETALADALLDAIGFGTSGGSDLVRDVNLRLTVGDAIDAVSPLLQGAQDRARRWALDSARACNQRDEAVDMLSEEDEAAAVDLVKGWR